MALPLAIAVAGALGALCRWGLTAAVQRALPGVFPWGTFVVNVIGCFLLGWLTTLLVDRLDWNLAVRTAVLSGFLGAFTTFSTFSFDTLELVRTGHVTKAALNVVLSLGIGLFAVWVGVRAAGRAL